MTPPMPSEAPNWHDIRICTQRVLPASVRQFEAAQIERPANIPHGVAGLDRVAAVGTISKKWSPGRVLHVRFLDGEASVQQRVAAIAKEWERHANVTFAFDASPGAEVRVTFARGGSWSYVGTDVLGVAADEPTMQLGWLDPETDEAEVRRVVLHEFGHVLGLQHEHQNPGGGIPWDRAKVYAYYAETQDPPWTPAEVDRNVLEPLARDAHNFTAFDRDSIMAYAVPAELTVGGFHLEGNGDLSRLDRELIGQLWYPRPRPNLGVADTAVVARESQHLDVFWIGPDGAVATSWWHEGQSWSAPEALAGPGSAHPGAIAAAGRESGHLDVFWVAPDGAVRTAWWHEGGPWSAPSTIAPAGSADPGALSVLTRSTDHLDVFWIAGDGAVMTVWWHEGEGWSAPTAVAGPDSAEPGAIAAVARTTNHIDLFWVGQSNEVASAWWHEGSSWSVPFSVAGPGAAEPGSIGCVARLSNHIDVFWTNADGAVMSAWWHENAKWSAPFAVTPPKASMRPGGVVATARLDNHLDVFWTAPDRSTMTAWWHEGQSWSSPYRLTDPGAGEERSLAAVARLNNHLDLFWVRPDGAIASQWWHAGRAWAPPLAIAGTDAAAA